MFYLFYMFQVCMAIYWQYGRKVEKDPSCLNITEKNHIFKTLSPFTGYKITVQASTSKGFGNETVKMVYTLEGGKWQPIWQLRNTMHCISKFD